MAKDALFNNLAAEMARAKITKAELAAKMGISTGAMYSKLNGNTEFTLDEMIVAKEFLQDLTDNDITLDYLFKKDE